MVHKSVGEADIQPIPTRNPGWDEDLEVKTPQFQICCSHWPTSPPPLVSLYTASWVTPFTPMTSEFPPSPNPSSSSNQLPEWVIPPKDQTGPPPPWSQIYHFFYSGIPYSPKSTPNLLFSTAVKGPFTQSGFLNSHLWSTANVLFPVSALTWRKPLQTFTWTSTRASNRASAFSHNHYLPTTQTQWVKKLSIGNSLEVQWLGHYAPFTVKGPGSIPCQRTKIPQATQCGQKENQKQS